MINSILPLVVSGGYDEIVRLFGGGLHHEGDEASQPGPAAGRVHAGAPLLHCHRVHVTGKSPGLSAVSQQVSVDCSVEGY